MPRTFVSLLALVALLSLVPATARAQDDAADRIVGTWVGIEMDGEAMPEGEFSITFHADGSGEFTEHGDDADPFTYTFDAKSGQVCTVRLEGEEPFSFSLDFEGETVTFTPTDDDGPPPLKLRRVGADAGEEPMPAPAVEGDAGELLGTWIGLTMDDEALDEGDFSLIFEANGHGAIIEDGDDPEPFTYEYDPEARRCVIYFGGEGEGFPIDIEFDGDTATFTPTQDDDVLVARREGAGDADDDEPGDGMPAEDLADNPMVGVWAGVSMGGEEIPDGAFTLTVNPDGTGHVTDGKDDPTPEPYTYTYDAATGVFVVTPEVGEPFTFTMTFEGDLATMSAGEAGGPPPIVLRRVGGDAEPGPVDLSDSPLVGRWELVSFNGETLPEGTTYVFVNHADGTGSSFVNGEAGDPYTWRHDFETGVATFTHPDQEPAAFTFEIEDGVATYVSTDGEMTIVERRIDDDAPVGEPAPEPAPVDMSESPLVGLWMLIKFNDQDVPEDLVVYEHRPDGTGTVIESGERGEDFRWNHDIERSSIVVEDAQGEVFEFTLVVQDDLVFYVSKDGSMRIVHRRAGDLEPTHNGEELVGTWMGLKMGDEVLEPGEFSLTFNADGTGELNDGGEEPEPFTYAYNSATKLYSIQVDEEEPVIFSATIDGDELTIEPVGEGAPPTLLMRRVVEEDPDDGNAMDPDGVIGTWYVQQMRGEWIPADQEFRLEFRPDGTAHTFENNEPESEAVNYSVDEERSVITVSDPDNIEIVLIEYEMFDDIMIMSFREPGGLGGAEEILLCRRPEGNEEHRRQRAAVDGRDGAAEAVDDAAEAVEDAVDEAIDE
ncbi:MAG: hypothetical protein ACIAXF_13660 [Phycisphaerales bacterium JB063]